MGQERAARAPGVKILGAVHFGGHFDIWYLDGGVYGKGGGKEGNYPGPENTFL